MDGATEDIQPVGEIAFESKNCHPGELLKS